MTDSHVIDGILMLIGDNAPISTTQLHNMLLEAGKPVERSNLYATLVALEKEGFLLRSGGVDSDNTLCFKWSTIDE